MDFFTMAMLARSYGFKMKGYRAPRAAPKPKVRFAK